MQIYGKEKYQSIDFTFWLNFSLKSLFLRAYEVLTFFIPQKTNFVMLLITLLLQLWLSPNTDAIKPSQQVSVTINAIDDQNGPIVFLLFDRSDGFPSEPTRALQQGKVEQYTHTASYTFTNVPAGVYAIAAFQDNDANGKVTTNLLGFPKEAVAASNMQALGRPSFSKCSFTVSDHDLNLQLKFINQ